MMTAVAFTLIDSDEPILLPKTYIRSALQGSLLWSILEVDPEVTEIKLNHPAAHRTAFEVLARLAQGKEPIRWNPCLWTAGHYLNIPELCLYSDPLYNGRFGSPQRFIRSILSRDRLDFVTFLLNKGWQPTEKNLCSAIQAGAVKVTQLLLTLPQIPRTQLTVTAYLEACKRGHLEVIRRLPGHIPGGMGCRHSKALRVAARWDRGDVVTFLLEQGEADPLVFDRQILEKAVWRRPAGRNVDLIKRLLCDRRFHDRPDFDPLYWAVNYGLTSIVLFLLYELRVNPTADNHAAFYAAVLYDWKDIVRLFLAHPDVDPAFNDNAAVIRAAQSCNINTLKLLLADLRVNPAAQENKALKLAQVFGNTQMEQEPNPVLHEAIKKHRMEVVQILLADPRIQRSLTIAEMLTLIPGSRVVCESN